jgi:hypothetical protein
MSVISNGGDKAVRRMHLGDYRRIGNQVNCIGHP